MFSQEYKLNVLVCDGCPCRCSLGTMEKDKGSGVFYPMINGRMISTWTDVDGVLQNWGHYVHQNRTSASALARARQIAKVCDHYKTGIMPQSGSVKCTMCNLPDSEKCDLHWMPYVGKKSFHASIGGPHCRFGNVPVGVMPVTSTSVEGQTPTEVLNKLRMYIAQNCSNVNSR